MNPIYTLLLDHKIFPLKYAITMENIELTTNYLTKLNIQSDSIIIDSIIIPVNCDINNSIIEISINSYIIWQIPLSFIKKICYSYIYKNKIYIQLNKLLGQYPIEFPVFYNLTNINIIVKSNTDYKMQLLIKKKDYPCDTYRLIKNYVYSIYQYQCVDVSLLNNISKKNGLSGLYFEINKKINDYTLFINDIAI